MKEIIEIANQGIVQLDKIIKQELDKISTDKRNEFDARMQTFEIVLDDFASKSKLQCAEELRALLKGFIDDNSQNDEE